MPGTYLNIFLKSQRKCRPVMKKSQYNFGFGSFSSFVAGFKLHELWLQNVIYFYIIAMPKKSHFTILWIQNFVQKKKKHRWIPFMLLGCLLGKWIVLSWLFLSQLKNSAQIMVHDYCIEKCEKFSHCGSLLMALWAIFFATQNTYVNFNPGNNWFLLWSKGVFTLITCHHQKSHGMEFWSTSYFVYPPTLQTKLLRYTKGWRNRQVSGSETATPSCYLNTLMLSFYCSNTALSDCVIIWLWHSA